jgi:hypothetical protein
MPRKGQHKCRCTDCSYEWYAAERKDVCCFCERARELQREAEARRREVFAKIPTMEEIQAERRRRGVSLRYGGW